MSSLSPRVLLSERGGHQACGARRCCVGATAEMPARSSTTAGRERRHCRTVRNGPHSRRSASPGQGPSNRRKQAAMAGRILNRRELRKQADQADAEADVEVGTADAEAPEAPAKPAKKGAKAKAPAAAKPKKPRKKKAPVRMCARWAVYDTGMK